MIDLEHDELVSLSQLASRLPSTTGGRVNPATVFRWSTTGLRGHRLEVIRVGGRMLTSWAAYIAFTEALNSGRTKTPTQAPQSPRQQKRIRNAKQVLADAGIA